MLSNSRTGKTNVSYKLFNDAQRITLQNTTESSILRRSRIEQLDTDE